MKHILRSFLFLSLLFPMALASCKKISIDPYGMTYTLEVADEKIFFDSAWLDVIPSTNDFRYVPGCVSAAEMAGYSDDKSFIDRYWADLKATYSEFGLTGDDFLEAVTSQGADFCYLPSLEPDSDYVCFVFTIDNDGVPLDQLHKCSFKSKPYLQSTMTFEMSMTGSVLTVIPSNETECFFFEYDDKATIDTEFGGSPLLYHYYVVWMYQEYGFIESQKDKGRVTSDFADFFNLEEGDSFYLTASAYNYGINSKVYSWKVTYNGEGKQATIESFKDPLFPEE